MKNSSKNVIRSFFSNVQKECDKHWTKYGNNRACAECPFGEVLVFNVSKSVDVCKLKIPELCIEDVLRVYEETMKESSKERI